jgi:transcriptional regulator with XRE-family HTH domain
MRRRRVGGAGELLTEQCAIVGANIRALRQRRGWSQAKLGELMSWPSTSTVCAAEGRRRDRQRSSSAAEVEQLAAIFGLSPALLTTRCANCSAHPPAGFACLACGAGALPADDSPAASALPYPGQGGDMAARA